MCFTVIREGSNKTEHLRTNQGILIDRYMRHRRPRRAAPERCVGSPPPAVMCVRLWRLGRPCCDGQGLPNTACCNRRTPQVLQCSCQKIASQHGLRTDTIPVLHARHHARTSEQHNRSGRRPFVCFHCHPFPAAGLVCFHLPPLPAAGLDRPYLPTPPRVDACCAAVESSSRIFVLPRCWQFLGLCCRRSV